MYVHVQIEMVYVLNCACYIAGLHEWRVFDAVFNLV